MIQYLTQKPNLFKLTATVPNIAPLAPTEGMPTNAKLPPRMFL